MGRHRIRVEDMPVTIVPVKATLSEYQDAWMEVFETIYHLSRRHVASDKAESSGGEGSR